MNASRKWLEAFLRRTLDSRDVATRLAMLGAPVDAIERVGTDLSAFVVGLVVDVRQHPDADKLRVTTVDDGTGTMHSVVCGAPNVTAGAKYPFARLGTVMPNGMKIERRKLRGEVSEGMLCSARELGLGEDHDGLLTLVTDVAPGTPLEQIVDGGDERIVIDVTPNRADLHGHKGIARELAASYGVPIRLPEIVDEAQLDLPTPQRFTDEAAVGGLRVAIDDKIGCPRLLAAVIRGVTIGPSPAWLRDRLASVGVRSINNVVDATNYVMFELNQPMHAYDAATLRGSALIARQAIAGEKLTTLDGVERTMPAGATVIADRDGAIGVAGVMGGKATEVTPTTRDILLECATFDAAGVRRTRRALNLSTDASYRFERGTDRWGAVDALRRCIRLIVTIAGGQLDGNAVDCFPAPTHPPRIFLRPSRVTQVLGVDLPWIEIEKHLVAIGATVVSKPDDGRIAVDVPGWRPDITTEIDLVEEIARVHGYDEFPTELRAARPGNRVDDPMWGVMRRVRDLCTATGLSEVITLPMVATAGENAPRVLNPLSAEHGRLRDALLPSLVRQAESNWAAQSGNIRLFEIGNVFTMTTPDALPTEATHAAFVISGARMPSHWTASSKVSDWDRWDALAIFQQLVQLAQPEAAIQVEASGWIAVAKKGRVVGRCGRSAADSPPWAATLLGGEVELGGQAPKSMTFKSLPSYPAVSRDLALVLAGAQSADAIVKLLNDRGARHGLESVAVIDEYRGKNLPEGSRSITVRLVFRSADRTQTDTEVEQAVARLRASLERELDVTLRST